MNIKTIKRVFEEYRIQLDDDGTVRYGMVWYGMVWYVLIAIIDNSKPDFIDNSKTESAAEFRG